MDVTFLMQGRVHLTDFDCLAIRTLRQLKATFRYPFGPKERIEFVQMSNTNPERVTCHFCWSENPQVRATYTPRVVIDLRDRDAVTQAEHVGERHVGERHG